MFLLLIKVKVPSYTKLFKPLVLIYVLIDLAIPVGKGSMSMNMSGRFQYFWIQRSHCSVIFEHISCFSANNDTTRNLDSELNTKNTTKGSLVCVDLANGYKTLGGSALLQVYNQLGNECPTVRENLLKNFINASMSYINKTLLNPTMIFLMVV